MTTPEASLPSETAAIPAAFVYLEAARTPFGGRLTRRLEAVAKADLTLPGAVVTSMGESLDRGDRLGDAWFADARRRGTMRQAREEYHLAMEHGIKGVDDASPPLVELFDHIRTEPAWLDWDRLRHGARVFRRYGKELYPYFGMATFAGYRTPTVTKPLILTGAYTGNSAANRFWETCKHWTDLGEPEGMRPGRPGWITTLRVRLLHSMIRARIGNHKEWDRARLGVPISQFNMFNTLMAGSMFAGVELRRLGYRTSDDDIVALMHLFRYMGHVIGAEPPWYPETIDDGYRAMRLIALAQRPEDSEDSRALCHSFMDTYKPAPELTGLRRLKAELIYRSQLGHASFYTPDAYRKSGFPPAGLWRYAPLARVVPNFVRDTACQHVPGVADWVDSRHRAWRQAEVARTLGRGMGSYSPVATLSR